MAAAAFATGKGALGDQAGGDQGQGAAALRLKLIDDPDQFPSAFQSVFLGCEAFIRDQIVTPKGLAEIRPLLVFVEDREDEPTAVAALVVVGECVECLSARWPIGPMF